MGKIKDMLDPKTTIGLGMLTRRAKLRAQTIGACLKGDAEKRIEVEEKRGDFWEMRKTRFAGEYAASILKTGRGSARPYLKGVNAQTKEDKSKRKLDDLKVKNTVLLDQGFEM